MLLLVMCALADILIFSAFAYSLLWSCFAHSISISFELVVCFVDIYWGMQFRNRQKKTESVITRYFADTSSIHLCVCSCSSSLNWTALCDFSYHQTCILHEKTSSAKQMSIRCRLFPYFNDTETIRFEFGYTSSIIFFGNMFFFTKIIRN